MAFREELLARPGLAEEENRRVGRSDLCHLGEDPGHDGASGDDLVEARDGPDLVPEKDVLRLEPVFERGDLGDPAPEGGLGLPPVDRVREDRADEPKACGVGRRPVAIGAEAPRRQDRGQSPPDVEGHRKK